MVTGMKESNRDPKALRGFFLNLILLFFLNFETGFFV